MQTTSSASRRAPRFAWESDSDDTAPAALDAGFGPQQRSPSSAAKDPSGVVIAKDVAQVLTGSCSCRTLRDHPAPLKPALARTSLCLNGEQPSELLVPYSPTRRHADAARAASPGLCCEADGSCTGGAAGDGGSRVIGHSRSTVSITLSEVQGASDDARGLDSDMQESGRDASLHHMPSTSTAADGAVTSSSWATLTTPAVAEVDGDALPAPQHLLYGGTTLPGTTASATAPSPYIAGTLQYAAGRSLLCCSANCTEDTGDGHPPPSGAAATRPQGLSTAGGAGGGGAAVSAAAAAAAAALTAAADFTGPPHSLSVEGNPTPATPSLSTRSSYAGSFDSSSSVPVGSTVMRQTSDDLGRAVRASYDREPLASGLAVDAIVGSRSWGSGGRSGSSSSGSSSGRTDSDRAGGGLARGSAGREPHGGSSGNGGSAGCSRASSSKGQSKSGAADPSGLIFGGGGGADDGGSRGRTGICGGGGGAGDAAEPPAARPKKVQLSISFLPHPATPSQPPGVYGTDAAVGMPALLTHGEPLGKEMLAIGGDVYLGHPFPAEAAAAAAPPPPALVRHSTMEGRDAPGLTLLPSGSTPTHSSAAFGHSGMTAATAVAVAAAAPGAPAAVGLHNPGDGVVLVPEADSDLEDVDVVASVLVTSPSDAVQVMQPGGDAVADVVAAAAAVLAAGDDDGPGALPHEIRRRLSGHMGRQRAKSIRSWKDLSHSMASQPPGYWLLSTMMLLMIMVGVFLFMAGQYEFVRPIDVSTAGTSSMQQQQSDGENFASSLHGDPLSNYSWGPSSLAAWLAFWRSPPARTFNFDYLRLWGGRYGPDLEAGQWWRWVTSLLLHQSAMHLASNMALLLVLSAYLESLFGFWRVLPVWVVAGVAGNMASAFFENPCMLVVGSSGAVFGLLGAYMADAALNFESIPLLWLRLVGMAVVSALLVALQATGHSGGGAHGSSTSHASHIGGFLAGALLAVLLVPDFKANRSKKVSALLRSLGVGGHLPDPASQGGEQLYSFWQRHTALRYSLYAVVVVVLLLMLVVLPVTVYLHTFRRMVCG